MNETPDLFRHGTINALLTDLQLRAPDTSHEFPKTVEFAATAVVDMLNDKFALDYDQMGPEDLIGDEYDSLDYVELIMEIERKISTFLDNDFEIPENDTDFTDFQYTIGEFVERVYNRSLPK